MLLVHGWSCDHTYFAPQFERFSRSHRVVAVDLRGHGASDAPRQAYTMAGFADDLAWLCGERGIERPVAIGHSMGGAVVLELAARYPDLPGAIVMVDGATVAFAGPLTPTHPRYEFIRRMRGPEYREVARGFVEQMFLPTDDPARRARILEQMLSTPQHVMASAMEQVSSCDMAAAAAACRIPALYIQAAAPRPELARFRELCPQLITGQTVGAGHFNQLEVPDQVNAMIERFLAISLPAGSPRE
jgi:pimeloyl-ACP methyl ester carboxylesterase